MKKITYILSFVLMLFVSGSLLAQHANPATGGEATGSGGSSSYTVGQVVYTTNVGPNGSVAGGVQQPYEISVVTALKKTNDILLVYKAFPNPVKNILTLSVKNFEGLTVQLLDVNGKQLINKKIEKTETEIDMVGLPMAAYFLKVTDNKKELSVLKIIKN
jgi:hypothetical protein